MVVMAGKELIRSAVSVVKAGADDYLTYPIDPSEVRLVVEDIDVYRSVSLELDHLRDRFWGAESAKSCTNASSGDATSI